MAMQADTSATDASMFSEGLFLVLCQNNEKKQVKIVKASDELAAALGMMRSELEGQPLEMFLGAKAAESMQDYLEYDDMGPDVDSVLSRVREFKLKHHKGEELPFACRWLREPARDTNQWFRLMLKDEKRQIQDRSLQTLLRENLAGVISLDEETGLADRHTCERYLEQVHGYIKNKHVVATFAVIRLDRYEKSLAAYGAPGCRELLQHIARNCKATFREEDLVCRLSDGRIGLMLMDANTETARVVLNRLRWLIASHRIEFAGKSDFSVTVSVSFKEINADNGDTMLRDCEQAIINLHADERNQLIEA